MRKRRSATSGSTWPRRPRNSERSGYPSWGDPAFGRGGTPYERVQGDAARGVAGNPNVAPIEHGPFYAVKLLPGSLGTFAGLRTDASARVLAADGVPIAGLYACGADMASVMGGRYPSGGITLGPAMTFGYIAGQHAAGAPA